MRRPRPRCGAAADCPETTLAPTVERLRGPVPPGLVNVHSHAFQRAMAGFGDAAAKGRAGPRRQLLTWREVMYRFLATLGPAEVEAIATWLYIELLRCGFTTVVEFTICTTTPAVAPRRSPGAFDLSSARRRASRDRAHAAVFYAHSGTGAPPTEGQRRFVHDVDGFPAAL